MQSMPLVAIVTVLALIEFAAFGGMVGYARSKYGVTAPAISGQPIFERHFRVHYNTLEQWLIFLPSMWLFAVYVDPTWAASLGAVVVVARIPYAIGYVRDPKKREFGSILGTVALLPLLFGGLVGAIRAL
ncbi:MAG TPA: MAPEG family protein [Steroidobacteraceae bacterium]|nr:MAPEG family protein [Steroidobacteraceae bacterium]